MRRWRFAGYREKVGNPQIRKSEVGMEIAEGEGQVGNPQAGKNEASREIAEIERQAGNPQIQKHKVSATLAESKKNRTQEKDKMQEADKKTSKGMAEHQLSKAYREDRMHGAPGFPMRVYWNDFSTYVAGQVPWHWHEELEFCVITQGNVTFSLPGDEICLSEGQGIFINANTLHHMVPAGEEAAYMFSVVVHPGMLGADKGFLLSSKYIRPYVKDSSKPFYVLNGNLESGGINGKGQHHTTEVVQRKVTEGVQHKATEGTQRKATEGAQHKATEGTQRKATEGMQRKATEGVQHKATEGVQHKATEGLSEEQAVLELLHAIYGACKEQQYANEYRLHNMICEVWYKLIRIVWNNEPAGKAVKDIDSERLYQALHFIQENYGTDISLDDICKATAVGRSECCRLFKRNLQMSPISYLITYRINMAAARLENSNDSITRIAMDHGFTDDSYFCKIFKRYMQVTPLEYRKQRSGKNGA